MKTSFHNEQFSRQPGTGTGKQDGGKAGNREKEAAA
jgi:hypothetical protein